MARLSFAGRQAPPTWVRWAVPIVVAAALIAGVVIAVHRSGPEGPSSEAAAEAEVNRISDIAISEDQAPRSAPLPAAISAATALQHAIEADVRGRITHDQLTGPLQDVSCATRGAPTGGRVPYRCTVRSAGIAYTFIAVADERHRRLTWCKVDPPPDGTAPEIRLSASCRA